MQRLIRSAVRSREATFFADIHERFPAPTRLALDNLLYQEKGSTEESDTSYLLYQLKESPGKAGLKRLLHEVEQLRHLQAIDLPDDLFRHVPPKVLEQIGQLIAKGRKRTLRGFTEHPFCEAN